MGATYESNLGSTKGYSSTTRRKKNLPSTMIETKKMEMLETAYSTMILYFSDSVLRKCNKETIAASLWLKLESLYMTKSLNNQIC